MSNQAIVLRPACIKTLSAVEARPERSNQHEFNGVAELKNIFGGDKLELNTKFSVRGGDVSDEAGVTWYDARAGHPVRSEFRLYFQKNKVMDVARPGDNIVVGYDKNKDLHCILIRSGSLDHNPNIEGWEKL